MYIYFLKLLLILTLNNAIESYNQLIIKMKKNIVRYLIASIIFTLASLTHKPIHATAPDIYTTSQQNCFFSKNNNLPLHWGLKTFIRRVDDGDLNILDFQNNNITGLELCLGAFLEWHFCNGIGIQTGILLGTMETHNLSINLNNKTRINSIWALPESMKDCKSAATDKDLHINVACNKFTLTATSIPLTLRIYPEKNQAMGALWRSPVLISI